MTNLTDDDFNLGASQLRGNSDRQTRTIYMDPLAEDPEEAAKRRRLSELSELPQSDILANPGMGERAAAALTADRALRTTPRLRDWMNEPENAAVARDDIENLSVFERLSRDVFSGNIYRRLGPSGDVLAAATMPLNPLGAGGYMAQRQAEGGADPLASEQGRQGQLDVEYAGLAYRAQQEARGYTPLTAEERARLEELATRDGQDNWGPFLIGPTRRLIPQLVGSFSRGATEAERRFNENWENPFPGMALVPSGGPNGGGFRLVVTPNERSTARRVLEGGVATVAQAPGAAVATFGGAVGGYLSFGYEMETGMAFDQMVRAGIQPDIAAHRAEQYGAWATAIEFASDTLGLRISGTPRLATRMLLGERFLARRPLVRATEAVVGMGLEQGLEESAQEYAQILHQDLAQQDQGGGQSRVRWSEVLTPDHIKQILLSGYIGFQGGLGMGAVPSSINLALDVRAARQAEAGARRFEEMTRAAQASRLNERGLASTLESAVGAMDGSSVYIDADRFVEHFQAAGANAYAIADELGVGEQRLADALASHGQVEIPTARFVARVLRIPQHASLAEHTRATPEAATPAEMQNAEQVLKAQAERIVEETKTIESDNELGRAIETRMRELFQAAEREGGPRADVARRYAQLAAALPRAMVARARVTDGAYADRLEQQFRHLFGVNLGVAGPGREAGAGGSALDQRPVGVDAGPTRNDRWDPPEGVRMSDKMREIVELAVNGASNDYIAEGMGVEANNVRVTLSQAKARLKKAGLSAPWEEGATGLPRGTNPRTGAGTYTTEELVALFDQLAAAGYTNSAGPGGDNINTIIARRTGMNVKTVASRLSKHRAAMQEAERATVREPEPQTAMEMRRQWVETQVVRHTVPGGEPGDFHYGFVLSSGKQMYVGIADDGNGAANIDWSFLERLKNVDEDNPTALYGDGEETLGIADGRELRVAIRAIFEADMAAHERPAYMYTPQRESNRRSNAKLREEMGDALGYDLLEDQGSVYLIRPGAGIANTGRIKPQPGWEPNFEEPQEYGSQEDADDAQNAFYARVEAVEVSADGPNLSEIARATRRERKEAEGRRAAAEQDAGGNARGDGSELEQNSARGSIRYENFRAGEFGQAMIRMGKSSDLSTFLHEFGHLGHLVLESMATDAAAPAEFKSMWTNTLQWWGLTQAEWDALTVEQKTPHFERWARTFEAYLMEGKAPSFSLRESFAAFKAWLTQIYRTVFRLNANLSPEIRDVFDRLLATDAEIAQARAAMGADFALAREAFKTEEEFQQYQQAIVEARDAADAELRARVMDAQVRKDKRWWRAERERVRATAEIEVDTAPARRAFEWLAYGEWRALPVEENEEGVVLPSNAAEQMPEDLPDMRLDWASLSEEERAGLPAEMRPLLDEGDVDAAVESAMALKRQGRQRQPQRLWAFIKAQGGIKDEGGEVMQALGSARSRPGLINNSTGLSADELALRAWEAGYFGRVPGQTELGQERPDAEQLRAEGFDIEDPLYRGHEGDPSTGHWRASEGMNGEGVYLTRDPVSAERWARRQATNNPTVHTTYARGRIADSRDGITFEEAQAQGYSGLHYYENGQYVETVVFDPANVSRSVARRTLNAPDGGAAGAGNQSAWARVKDAVLGRAPDIEANIWIGPKSALWDAERAAQAEAMAQRGASPQEIWRETATFRGSDGSWRQETGLVPFSRAYPNARAHVRRELFDRGGGSYARVGPFNLISGNEPRALTHELNHLASSIEGFAPGGNPIRAGIEAMLRGEQFRGAYERLPGEIDAERAAQRYHLNDEQRVERFPGTLTSADRMRQAAGLAPDAPNASTEEGGQSGFEFFQGRPPAPIFESAVLRAVERSTTTRAPASQWLATIQKTPGVKKEELEWIGLADFLNAQPGLISRDDVLNFVRENGVQVEETIYGAAPEALNVDQQRELLELIEEQDRLYADKQIIISQSGRTQGQLSGAQRASFDRVMARLEEIEPRIEAFEEMQQSDRTANGAKWSTYQLPGGQNYRELLLRIPELTRESRQIAARLATMAEDLRREFGERWVSQAPAERLAEYDALGDRQEAIEKAATFRHQHWQGASNVLAHIRFTERVDADGRRTLFLEEVQSDWHQAGRKNGYRETSEVGVYLTTLADPAFSKEFATRKEADAYARANRMHSYNISSERGVVPQAPFKNNGWARLSIKRMIRWAAENGFEQIAWVRGQHALDSVARHLEKSVGSIMHGGMRTEAGKAGGDLHLIRLDNAEAEALIARRKLGRHYENGGGGVMMTGEQVRQVFGEDLGGRILGLKDGDTLTGADFRIGGEGMRAFYDRIMVNIANDLGKKFGARVGETDIRAGVNDFSGYYVARRIGDDSAQPWFISNAYGQETRPVTAAGEAIPGVFKFASKEEAEAALHAQQYQTVHSLPITPQMRSAVTEQGQELFQDLSLFRSGELYAGANRPTVRELLDALIDDLKNIRQVYSSKDADALAANQARTDALKWFDVRGIDLSGTKENIRAQIVAAMEEEQGRENAVDADTAASWFGFSSGAEMLDAIKGLKPRSVAIEENIDARLEGEYGDPLKDGTVAESARLAAHIEAQARRIEIELEAIQRATGGKKTPVGRAARAFAERQVQHMTVKQIREADQFLAAERRAARAAMEATQKKDFQTAGLMKQRQLISFHLYKLATDAAAEMERTQRYFQKFSRDTVRAKITPQHLDQIDQALEGIDLRSRPRINDRKRQSFQNWFDQMREAGLEHMVVADPDFLEQVRNKPFASLTLEEARAIRDAVRNLEHIGRRWREVLAARDQRLLDEAVGEMTASMAGVQPFEIANADNHSPGVVERLDRGRQALHGQLSRVEPVARAMDRNKDNGPVWNGLFRPLTEARDREEIRQEQAQKAIEALFSVYSAEERADMWVKRKFYPQVPNRTGSRMGRNFTKQEILALALNTGNEYNLGALLEGERKNSGMTEQQLRALLDVAMDQRDWEFVQSAWDYVNSFWPEIEALYVKTAGVAPAKVQPTPFTNRYGEWRGGYWHLEYDYGRDQRARDEADFVAVQEAFGGFRTRTQTPNGFSKARQGSGGRPVRLDLAILSEHVNEVIHDLEFRLPVLNVWRVIKHQGFRDAFVRAAGQEMYDTLKPWLQFTATERMPPERGFSGIIKTLRRNTPIALMGYAISTIAQQPAGLMGTFHRVGTARVMGKALQLMSQPWTWGEHARFINTRSHMMRNRSRISQRELREMIQEINSDAHVDAVRLLTAGTARQKVQALGYLNRVMQRYALFPLAFLDKWVSSAAWKAAYDRALAGHVDGVSPQNEADVIAYADQVIRTTFGSGRPEDMAPIMRSSEVLKLITPAFSYFNTQYNQLYNEQVPGMMRGHISPLEFVTFITFTLVMQALVSQWLAGRWDPDDGEDEDDRNARLAMEVAMTPVAGVPLVRDMTRAALRSAVTGERFSASTVPAFGAIGATASGVGGSLHDLSEDGEISRQSAKDLTMAAGYWFGLPSRQMWTTGSYLSDVASGDEDLPWNSDQPIQTTSEALLRDTR